MIKLGSLLVVALLAGACSVGASATPVATVVPTAAPTVAATASVTAGATSTPAETTATTKPHGGRSYGGGPSASPSAAASVVVSVGTTTVGSVLVGPTGNTLYVLAGDTTSNPACTGGCLSAWPPLLVTAGGKVTAGAGVKGKLATFTRSDGTVQVTYDGHPLYYFAGDTPGSATGQGEGGFTAAKP